MIVIPCCGVCSLGRLTVDAAHIAFRDDRYKIMALGPLAIDRDLIDKSQDILVINGCEKICSTQILHSGNTKEKWCLTLTDLGLSKRNDGVYDKEDLRLVIDALEATCADVGDQVPNLGSCGCC